MTAPSMAAWNIVMARLIGAIDQPVVLDVLMDGLSGAVAFDNWYAVFFRDNATPVEIDHSEKRTRRERYVEGPYLLDPFYTAFINGAEPGCHAMRDLAPPDFRQSRYYIEYYAPWGAGDEIGYLLPVSEGVSAHLSLARKQTNARFSKADRRFMEVVQPVVHEVFRRIWPRIRPDLGVSDAVRIGFHFRISQAFRSFGTSVLTEREGEITHLLLRGHSAKSAARLLGISPGTVRNHMKSIYIKLKIGSQSELFGLFFEALSSVEGDVNVDPLAFLRDRDGHARFNG